MVLLGGAYGFTETEATGLVSGVFGLLGSVFLVRQRIKSTTVTWRSWIANPNTINYLVATLAGIIPNLPAGLGKTLNDIIAAALNKNWSGLVAGFFSLATIIYFFVTQGKVVKSTPAK